MTPETHLIRNLEALAAYQRVPADRLTSEPTRVRVEQANGVAVLLARRSDAWIALNSRRDPVAEALRGLDETLDGPEGARRRVSAAAADAATVIVIGAGLGYVLDALDRRCPGARVIAVEPHAESARAFLEHRDWSARVRDGRLRLLVGPEFTGSDRLLWMLEGSRPPLVLDQPVLAREWPDEMAAARRAAAAVVFAARANQTARLANAGRYLTNTLRNVPAMTRESDIDRLDRLFPGVPALLVSAGPSLDRTIAELGRLRDRAVIVAVDTALRPLLGAGIVPHVVVSLDSSRLNAEHLLDLSDVSEVALVAEGSISPIALEPFRGRIFTFRVGSHHPWPWLTAAGCNRGELRVWGSVATAALDLIRRLGCDPVVFCGQDLAYTGGRAYCTGTTWDLMGIGAGKRPEVVTTDLDGRPATTAAHLVSFRDWLVEQSLVDTARRYVNASGDGILHGGRVERLPLDQALAGHQALDDGAVRAAIRSAHRVDPSEGGIPDRLLAFAGGIDPLQPPGEEPLASWLAFAGPAVSAAAVVNALAAPGAADVAPVEDLPVDVGPGSPACDRIAAACDRLDPGRHRRAGTLAHRDLARMEAIVRQCEPRDARVINPDGMTALLVAACIHESARLHITGAGAGIGSASSSHDLVVLNVSAGEPDIDTQLRDACEQLHPEGLLVIVDLTDRVVGAAIRRALDRHLTSHPEFTLIGRRMYDWFSRLTLLRRNGTAARQEPPAGQPVGVPVTRSDAATLAGLIVRHLQPASVAAIGSSSALWADSFAGYPGVALAPIPGTAAAADHVASRYDVALGLDALALVEPAREDHLVRLLTSLSDTIVLTMPTPGWELTPDANQRPMAYWAERFLEHGYVLSDELRPWLEDRADFSERLYDVSMLYVARRIASPEARAAVIASPELRSVISAGLARIEDLFLQSALLRLDRRAAQPQQGLAPRARTATLPLDTAAIDHTGGHGYVMRFSQPHLRHCLRSGLLRHAAVEEDGCTLSRAQSRIPDIELEGAGRHLVRSDGVYFSSSDNTDPRLNGRRYALRVPAEIALAGLTPAA